MFLTPATFGQTDPGPVKSPSTTVEPTESGDEPPPGTPAKADDREFKPTEKVSPDQEVDFPADL
ncbi:MAG: hypothetical protein ACT4QA_00800 [Panacagrimonas sp.]